MAAGSQENWRLIYGFSIENPIDIDSDSSQDEDEDEFPSIGTLIRSREPASPLVEDTEVRLEQSMIEQPADDVATAEAAAIETAVEASVPGEDHRLEDESDHRARGSTNGGRCVNALQTDGYDADDDNIVGQRRFSGAQTDLGLPSSSLLYARIPKRRGSSSSTIDSVRNSSPPIIRQAVVLCSSEPETRTSQQPPTASSNEDCNMSVSHMAAERHGDEGDHAGNEHPNNSSEQEAGDGLHNGNVAVCLPELADACLDDQIGVDDDEDGGEGGNGNGDTTSHLEEQQPLSSKPRIQRSRGPRPKRILRCIGGKESNGMARPVVPA